MKTILYCIILAFLFISCSSEKIKYSDEQKPYVLPDKYEKMSQPGLVYISHISNNFVSVLDLSSQQLIGKIPCGTVSMCTFITPDGKRGYISNYESGDVTVFDAATNETVTTVVAGENPTFLLAVNGGKDLLISHQSSEGIWVMNTSDNSIRKSLKNCTGPLYLVKKEKVYQPQIFTPYLFVIDPGTLEVTKKIETGGRPMEMTFSPGMELAYMSNYDSSEVAVFDTKTDSIVSKIKNIPSPRGIAATSNGKLVFVTNVADSTLTVIDAGSKTVNTIIRGFHMPTSVGISPDDRFAIVTNQAAGTVSIIEISSLSIIKTINTATNPIFLMVDKR